MSTLFTMFIFLKTTSDLLLLKMLWFIKINICMYRLLTLCIESTYYKLHVLKKDSSPLLPIIQRYEDHILLNKKYLPVPIVLDPCVVA